MPRRFLALSLAMLLPLVCLAESAAEIEKKLAGSWKLISMEGLNQNSQVERAGIIMYDGNGHMSVQIFNAKRPGFSNSRAAATDKEKADAYSTYTAYYGSYTIEPENGVVVHHLEGSITPGQIGQDYIRYFEFRGNRLVLSVGNDGKGGRLARKDTTAHVTWEKLPTSSSKSQ